MKKIFVVMLALVLTLTVAACAKKTGGPKEFKSSTEVHTGGTAQTDANLKDIMLEKVDGGIKLTFSFVSGSNVSAENEAAMTGLPQYELKFYAHPVRLVLSVNELKYWDYQLNSTLYDESGLVLGMFKLLPVNNRTNTVFYINLAKDVTYGVEEADGKLMVTLKPIEKETATVYYVVGNLFNEYQDGQLPEIAGLTPTLAKDLGGVVMISQAFADKASAESLKAQIEEEYALALGGKALRIVEIPNNTLPDYDDAADLDALSNKILIFRNNQKEKGTLIFPDARFLTWSPDGQTALFAKTNSIPQEDEIVTEQIYSVDKEGKRTLLFNYELAQIAFALYSSDGSKILLVEQINEVRLCNIYDLNTKTLTTIDESELGSAVTGCAWSEDGKSLYAMAGNEMLMVRRYDLETKEITTITTVPGIDSELFIRGNILYYLDVSDEVETVFALNLETDESTEIAKAEFFTMSPDGNYILLKNTDYDHEEGYAILDLYSTKDKTKTNVATGMMLNDYFFSVDGKKIYIIADNTEANANEYLYSVYEYDIEAKSLTKLFDSVNAVFAASNAPDEMILSTTYTKADGDYPVTYKIKTK